MRSPRCGESPAEPVRFNPANAVSGLNPRELVIASCRVMSMKAKSVGPLEIFKPAIVWRASQCGWLRVGKTGHDIWDIDVALYRLRLRHSPKPRRK
jgi:hypothetical protein